MILCCIVLYCRKEGTCVVMSTVFQPQSLHKAISLPSKSRNGNRHCCVLQSCYVLKQTWAWTLHSSKQMHQISLSFFAHDFCKRIVMTFDGLNLPGRASENCPGKMEWIQSARWPIPQYPIPQYHNTQYHNGMDSVCTRTLPAPSQLCQCLGHAMHKRRARSNIEKRYI